jgi:DnaJ like chaperone protein
MKVCQRTELLSRQADSHMPLLNQGCTMMTYIAIALLGMFILYTLSNKFSGGLTGVLTGNSSSRQRNDIQELFFRTVFTLLGYVAKHDGAVNQREVKRTEVFMEKMELDADRKREAIRLFKLGTDPKFQVDKTLKQFQWLAEKSPNLVQILLVYLINLARVDGLLVNKEIEAVQKVALGLGYSNITFNHLLKMVGAQNNFGDILQKKPPQKHNKTQNGGTAATKKSRPPEPQKSSTQKNKSCEEQTRDFHYRPDQLATAYAVFDLPASATDAEIKQSYRSLVNQYHPDKLTGLGLPSYMIQSATECFQKIQAAYQYIKDARKNT